MPKTLTIGSLFQLIRLKVSLAVTFSAFAAGVICAGYIHSAFLFPILGIFLFACGASVLNQFQEIIFDRRMDRTRNRPLASGLMSPGKGLLWALLLLSAGIIVLVLSGKWISLILGIFNILWYNGFYIWLKRKTAFAIVPGAFTGAIPVLMGWSAAGGLIYDRVPWFLAFFIFLWQIPHFWLLMLKYGDEYRDAGLPVLSAIFSIVQMKRIIIFWLLAASVSSLLLITTIYPRIGLMDISVIILNLALLLLVIYQLFISRIIKFRVLFASVNIFMLVVLLLLTIESILK